VGVLFLLRTMNPASIEKATSEKLPLGAVAYLSSQPPLGPMYNSYNFGGYFIYALPQYQVFVDGRTDLYPDEFLFSSYRAWQGIGWRELFAEWDIRLVVVETSSPLAYALSQENNWAEVFRDNVAIIFRATP
jgi:hypothetical protein